MVQRERAAFPHVEEGGFFLCQLNCVRLVEPGPADDVTTKDASRLFVPVRIMDDSAQIAVRMRESAALQASGQTSKEDFETAVRQGGLRFPILSSVRVRVKHVQSNTNATDRPTDGPMDVVVVEAEQQAIEPACRPNSALVSVAEMSRALGSGPTNASMLVGKLSDIKRAPHAGLSVEGSNCDFALTLCAVKAKSTLEQLSAGYRVVTSGLHQITLSTASDPPELIEEAVQGKFVSMCTMENLVQFNLSPSKPKGTTYCLALISSILNTADVDTYIVDRVSDPIQTDDRLSYALLLDNMSKLAKLAKPDERSKRSPEWAQETCTALTSAKKARLLSREPTSGPLPEPEPSSK